MDKVSCIAMRTTEVWLYVREGPGHIPVAELPAQSLCQRQLPALPLGQVALVQHLTLSGSDGQAPEMLTPPELEQSEVVMHTPGQGKVCKLFVVLSRRCTMLSSRTCPPAGANAWLVDGGHDGRSHDESESLEVHCGCLLPGGGIGS
jgi:hypothetical protein